MKSSITKNSSTNTTIVVTLDQDHLERLKKTTVDKLRGRVRVAGFRPGKAPDHIVEREIGSGVIQSEVIEAAINDSYPQAIKEHSIAVIAPPEVNVSKFVPFSELEYTASVDIMPEVILNDYRKMKKTAPAVTIEAAEIDKTIEDLRKRMATKQTVDRPARMGDETVIDFDGLKDGQPIDGGSAKGHILNLGSGSFIPGFEERLVDLSPGSEKTFKITFPQDYQAADLAGQEVSFSVKLHEVSELTLPEVNQEFIANISPFTTIDELRADISERIKTEKTEQVMAKFEQEVLDEIVDKSKWSAPKRLVEQQMERLRNELTERLSSSGLDIDKYLKLSNKKPEELELEMRPVAEKRVGLALVLNKIARAEGVSVTPAEIQSELDRLKATYADGQMQDELKQPQIYEDIENHLMASKTVTKIMEAVAG